MRPILFSIGTMHFHSYTAMFALAFLAGTILAVRANQKLENPFPVTTLGGIWAFFGGLVGAKVYWWFQYGEWEDLKWGQFLLTGGLVFYGGLIGGVLGCWLYLRRARAPFVPVADLAIPFLALAHGIARVGCFLNGCCWGAVTGLPWGVTYPKTSWGAYAQQIRDGLLQGGGTHALPVHPTQMYESIGLVGIFFLLRWCYRRRTRHGTVMLLYPLCYGLLRFGVEFFRGDSAHPMAGLTGSQFFSLAMVSFSVAGLLLWKRPTLGDGMPETAPETMESPENEGSG